MFSAKGYGIIAVFIVLGVGVTEAAIALCSMDSGAALLTGGLVGAASYLIGAIVADWVE